MKIFTFRKLTQSDVVTLYAWFNLQHVKEWYIQPSYLYEDISKKYSPRIKDDNPIDCYIILDEQIEVGFIQKYKIDETEEHKEYFITDSYGIDIFIGNIEYLHKGYGKGIIEKFLYHYIYSENPSAKIVISVSPEDNVALKVYKKIGFKFWKKIYNSNVKIYENIMILTRSDFEKSSIIKIP